MAVTHTKVSAVVDGADTSLVRPSDWNAAHAGTNTHTHTDGTSGGSTLAPVATHIADAAAHHAAPGAGPGANIDVDAAGDAGTANTYARLLHGHRLDTFSSVATDVAATATAGASGDAPARGTHVHEGLHSIAKSGSTSLVGDVTLAEGANITLTQVGQQISIAGAGSSGITTAEVGIPASALTPAASNGADPVELSSIGALTLAAMPFPTGLDRYAECTFPMPSYWNGGSINAYLHWAADTTASINQALDSFTRVVASGLGTAELGGAYTLGGSSSAFAVNGSAATFLHTASQERRGELTPGAIAFLSGQIYVESAWDKLSTGTGGYLESSVELRTQDTGGSVRYRVMLRRRTDATIALYIFRKTPTQTQLGTFETAITHTAGKNIATRIEVVGTNPTTIRVRAWTVGGSEPGTWDLEVTDSEASLQLAGGVALRTYTDPATTGYNHIHTWDALQVTTTGTGGATARWSVSATCLGDGTDIDAATFGTAGTVDDSASAGNWLITSVAAFTPSGSPAGGKTMQLRIGRLGTHANDDLSNEALLRAVRLSFTRT